MKIHFRSCATWLAILALLVLAAPALAQVPQDMTFTGRVVDNLGDPLAGPVDLELRVFDDEMVGNQLYSEEHLGVALDATGGFSVQLGMGTSPSGTFDAALFSEVDRWLEVVVGVEVLTPRQIIGSVPWALIAQQANAIVPDPSAPRFEDCGDGTVADHQTGLRWENKTGTVSSGVICKTTGCPDPHDVNNLYDWSNTGVVPDGGAFTDFLNKLNDQTFGTVVTANDISGCFAGHCDWRHPASFELVTIIDCANSPCIESIFGPTAASSYWSASTTTSIPTLAVIARFSDGILTGFPKSADLYVRAVRTGSCN